MKQLYLLLITLLVSLSAYAEESGTCGANLEWKLTDKGVLTITGIGEMKDWGRNARPWSPYSIKQVIIGDGVTTIGESAFYGCSSLASVTIGNGVTTIGRGAFKDCSSLTSVTIGKSVTSIADDAFDYTSKSKVIWLTNTPPSGYSSVWGSIHYVPNTSYRKLSNAKVYPSLSSIFEVGGIKYVPVSPSERTCDAIDCIYTEDANEINIDKKVSYKGFDMTVIDINPYTFSRNKYIKKANININDSIGESAFSGCPSLTSVTIGNSVKTIGKETFSGCPSLTSVTIGNRVKTIGYYAFSVCSSLTSVTIGNGVRTIDSGAFSGCSSLTSVTIGNGVRTIDSGAFSGCSSLTSITIPNSVRTIDSSVFSGCSSLASVVIPNSVTRIGYYAFSGCRSLTSVIIPNSVTTIENSVFSVCSSLTSLTIGNGVRTIGEWAFSGCSSLKSVTLPNSVTTIKEKAFSSCSSLTSLTIGNGVRTIESKAFDNCIHVMQISCDAELPPSCSTNLFDPINKWECKLFVPKNSVDAYKKADGWKEFFLIEGTTTGIINNIYNKTENVDVYTIDGIKRLSKASANEINALPKGIYIINGKKIIIK